MLQENRRSPDTRSINQRLYDRRRVLALATGALLSTMVKEKKRTPYRQIANYTADTYAHNVDKLSDLDKVKGTPYVEVDISQLKNGEIVVAHSLSEYEEMSPFQRSQQKTQLFIDTIRGFGGRVHLDTKREPEEEKRKPEALKREHDRIFREHILDVSQNDHTSVSGPDHQFLDSLVDYGFKGRLLYTLRSDSDVERFLKRYNAHSFSNVIDGEGQRIEFGVSVRFTVLTDRVAGKLKDEMGLYLLAWTPNTPAGALDALQKGVNGITSDDQRTLRQIGRNVPKTAK